MVFLVQKHPFSYEQQTPFVLVKTSITVDENSQLPKGSFRENLFFYLSLKYFF